MDATYHPNFPWTHYPEVKLLIYFYGRSRAEDEDFVKNRNWPAVGVTAAGLYAEVTKRFPWFPAVYRQETRGKELTPERVRDRFFNFFWDRSVGYRMGAPGISGEHPTRSPRLSPYLAMGGAVWEWLSADPGRTVSFETARELFGSPPISKEETVARLARPTTAAA